MSSSLVQSSSWVDVDSICAPVEESTHGSAGATEERTGSVGLSEYLHDSPHVTEISLYTTELLNSEANHLTNNYYCKIVSPPPEY